MKTCFFVLLFLFAFTCSQKPHFFPQFSCHTIDFIGSRMGQTDLADIDNDGDLDWVTAEAPWSGDSLAWWFEYQGPNTWIRHVIGKANSDVGGDCHDIDGDGWIDFWGGTLLFRNLGNGTFSRHQVGTIFSHDSQFEDINGDGKIDGLANWDQYGLVWYDIPADPTQTWIEHMIAPVSEHKIHGGVSPHAVGDLDGDGDADIVTGGAWYENRDGYGKEWQQHLNIEFGEEHKYGIALKTWVVDLDSDGDEDFVQSEADNPDSRVAWFENDGAGEWTRHIIKAKGDRQDFHSLAVADFDNDGDLDVFSGGGPLSTAPHKCYIWENTAPKNIKPTADYWVEHIVAEKPCHEAVAGDVDGDGDIDICSKPWSTGDEHFYVQNLLIP
ncbi:VCBS repeat-containing protein [candidate division KSB1 bacterium]|nr:VCBS repeat-containing protein [candidate division KSB1 bacterium]RQW00767.1 MAG: VCBS repeat-containing protein [candidate division KSB1 bacterium]